MSSSIIDDFSPTIFEYIDQFKKIVIPISLVVTQNRLVEKTLV